MVELTQEFIDEAKKKYGKVLKVTVGGDQYVYRTINRREFREIQKSITPQMTPQGPVVSQEQSAMLEDKVTELCTIWPKDIKADALPAGVPTILATYISNSSGFIVDEEPQAL